MGARSCASVESSYGEPRVLARIAGASLGARPQGEEEGMRKRMALAVLLAGVLSMGNGVAEEPVRIGVLASLTGAWSDEGRQMKQVVELLAEDLNEEGGVLGRKVELIVEDDGSDPRRGVQAARKLVDQKAAVVVGAYGSAVTEAVQGVLDKAKVLQISNGSTAVPLTEKGYKHFFRVCPRDDDQALEALDVVSELGAGKVALLHDGSLYSEGLATKARKVFEENGIQVVSQEALVPGKEDYRPVLESVRKAEPDLVFFTGYYPEAGILLKQKTEMEWDAPFLGSDAVVNSRLLEIAGEGAAEGFRFLSFPLLKNLPSPEAKAFLSDYEAHYGEPLRSIYALLGGDAFRVAVAAMKETESTDADKLAAYLRKDLKDFPGFTGIVAFDEKGDRVAQIYVHYQVGGGGEAVLQF